MATFNFLEIGSKDNARSFGAADLPRADALRALVVRSLTLVEKLRLINPDDPHIQGQGEPGPSSSPEDVQVNQRYVRLCQRFPQLLDRAGLNREFLATAFSTEQALLQVGGMVRQLKTGARAGAIVLAADLTAQVDRVENAVVARLSDTSLGQVTRASLDGRFSSPALTREALWARSEGRRDRAALRQRQAQAVLAQSRDVQAQVQAEDALREASAPPQLAAPAKTTRKKKS